MGVSYHDAKLRTVHIREDGDIVLSFSPLEGDEFQCVLRGVQHFCCDNFREGNTVFDRRLSESKEALETDLRKLLFMRPSETSKELIDLHDGINKGTFVFYKLLSSYGAVVLAVCQEVLEGLCGVDCHAAESSIRSEVG